MIIIMIIISDIIKSRSIEVVVVELPHARQIIMTYQAWYFTAWMHATLNYQYNFGIFPFLHPPPPLSPPGPHLWTSLYGGKRTSREQVFL